MVVRNRWKQKERWQYWALWEWASVQVQDGRPHIFQLAGVLQVVSRRGGRQMEVRARICRVSILR